SLEQEQKKQENKKQESGKKASPSDPKETPLVDSLAELKMIRSLQNRIKLKQTRLASLLDNPDDPVGLVRDPDMKEQLE
ncbi:hypothetical protein ABK046_51790, partial [Streptomyces caeruleatus]